MLWLWRPRRSLALEVPPIWLARADELRIRAALLRLLTTGFGTTRTSVDVRRECAKWAKADIDEVAVTNRDLRVDALDQTAQLLKSA